MERQADLNREGRRRWVNATWERERGKEGKEADSRTTNTKGTFREFYSVEWNGRDLNRGKEGGSRIKPLGCGRAAERIRNVTR